MQEVAVSVISIADEVHLERPFKATVKLQSHVDRQLGPLILNLAPGKPQWDCIVYEYGHVDVSLD